MPSPHSFLPGFASFADVRAAAFRYLSLDHQLGVSWHSVWGAINDGVNPADAHALRAGRLRDPPVPRRSRTKIHALIDGQVP